MRRARRKHDSIADPQQWNAKHVYVDATPAMHMHMCMANTMVHCISCADHNTMTGAMPAAFTAERKLRLAILAHPSTVLMLHSAGNEAKTKAIQTTTCTINPRIARRASYALQLISSPRTMRQATKIDAAAMP